MNNVDFSMLQDAISNFRSDDAAILPAFHAPHGDAEAWRLSEEMLAANSDR